MRRARYPLAVALRLQAIHRELNAQMDIRITEPVFFLGSQRRIGEVIRNVQVGPHRSQVIPGGLQRIPQFVEMPEEITNTITNAAAAVPKPASDAAAPAVASDLPPAPVPQPAPPKGASPAPVGNPLAARVRALTTRRAKFIDLAATIIAPAERDMTQIETTGPAILQKVSEAAHDELAAITDLGTSLKEMAAGANGDPNS